jgi:hypothetical protein
MDQLRWIAWYTAESDAEARASSLAESGERPEIRPGLPYGFDVLVHRDASDVPRPDPWRQRRVPAQPLSVTLLAWIAGAAAVFAFLVAKDKYVDAGFALIVVAVALLLAAFAVRARRHTLRDQQQRADRAREIGDAIRRGRDPGAFCLFLRPFRTSGRLLHENDLSGHLEVVDVEHMLAEAFDDLDLTQVALGQTGELFGSGLLDVADGQWQEVIQRAIDWATLILIVPGASRGTVWEMVYVASRHLSKTVFLMPACPRRGTFDWPGHWRASAERAAQDGIVLPVYEKTGGLFWIEEGQLIRQAFPERWTLLTTKHMLRTAMSSRRSVSQRNVLAEWFGRPLG